MGIRLFAASPFSGLSGRSIVLMAVPLVILAFSIIARRRTDQLPRQSTTAPNGSDANHYWLAGIIYCNPKNPAWVVRKRFGLGWTLNMGHWISWAILSGALLLPFVMRALAARH